MTLWGVHLHCCKYGLSICLQTDIAVSCRHRHHRSSILEGSSSIDGDGHFASTLPLPPSSLSLSLLFSIYLLSLMQIRSIIDYYLNIIFITISIFLIYLLFFENIYILLMFWFLNFNLSLKAKLHFYTCSDLYCKPTAWSKEMRKQRSIYTQSSITVRQSVFSLIFFWVFKVFVHLFTFFGVFSESVN